MNIIQKANPVSLKWLMDPPKNPDVGLFFFFCKKYKRHVWFQLSQAKTCNIIEAKKQI